MLLILKVSRAVSVLPSLTHCCHSCSGHGFKVCGLKRGSRSRDSQLYRFDFFIESDCPANVAHVVKCMWTPDYHPHVCLLQNQGYDVKGAFWHKGCSYKSLHSSRFHFIVQCGCEHLGFTQPGTDVE